MLREGEVAPDRYGQDLLRSGDIVLETLTADRVEFPKLRVVDTARCPGEFEALRVERTAQANVDQAGDSLFEIVGGRRLVGPRRATMPAPGNPESRPNDLRR